MVTVKRSGGQTKAQEDEKIVAGIIGKLSLKVDWLMEQLRLHRQKRFGASSEKTDEDGLEQMSLLFNETEVYVEQEKAEPVAVAAHVHNRKSGSVKDVVPDNIPVEVVEHRLAEDELSCPICGTEMVEIGKEIRQTLEIKPAQVYLREDWYYIYACRKCQTEGIKTPVVKTPKEPALIPGSFVSESAGRTSRRRNLWWAVLCTGRSRSGSGRA